MVCWIVWIILLQHNNITVGVECMARRLAGLIGLGRRSSGSGLPVSFKRFRCEQCGKCCTLSVQPTEQDIKKIEMLGYRHVNFLRKGMLRKANGMCMFLEKKDGRTSCKINEMKPKVCNRYPFTTLGRDKLFSCLGLHK